MNDNKLGKKLRNDGWNSRRKKKRWLEIQDKN